MCLIPRLLSHQANTFPHKIHIFSLDKTVCKQIRDNDVKVCVYVCTLK